MASNGIQTEKYINSKGHITNEGVCKLRKMYKLLTDEYKFTVGSSRITFDENNKRRCEYAGRKMIDANKKHIRQSSYFDYNTNILTVHTGQEYGGLIGVDIDVKGAHKDGIKVFEKWLKEEGTSYKDTFTCSTPTGGRHYIYYLDNYQMRRLSQLNFGGDQIGLFGKDIDIIYKYGRFYTYGYVRKTDGVKEYKIISYAKPIRLPDMIFTELLICIKKNIKPVKEIITKTTTKLQTSTDVKTNSVNNSNNQKLIVELLKCLKPERSNEYKSWKKISMILNNEYCDFKVFDDWSKTCPSKYDKEGNKKIWDKLERLDSGLKIGTLVMYAKEDNYNNYYESNVKQLVNSRQSQELSISQRIIESLNRKKKEHNKVHLDAFVKFLTTSNGMSLSMFFKNIYPDDYIYDVTRKVWYGVNKYGIYEEDTDELLSARTRICTEMLEILTTYMDAYIASFNPRDDEDKKTIKFYTKVLKDINTKTTSLGQKKNIIETLKELYAVKRLYKKMNRNIHIFSFNNGVYDLTTHTFRNATREDFVFGSCGYKYKTPKQEHKDVILQTIKNMFLKEELYEYFMSILSQRLVKENTKEEFYFLIGNASNGKGLVTTLIQETFGERSQVLESASFYKNRNGVSANAASPELASTKDCHVVFVNELERGAKLTADNIKKLSGNDKIKVRFLRENCFEFTPGYCLFFVSNHEPEIDGDDFGIRRRLRFIPFNVTFVDDPKLPTEKKIDRSLKRLFKNNEYKCAFFDILTEQYKKISGNEIKIPVDVLGRSKEFIENNDPVFKLVNDSLEKTNNQKDFIQAKRMMELFTAANGGTRGYTMASLKKRLAEFGIEMKKTKACNVYYCVREKVEEDEEEIINV